MSNAIDDVVAERQRQVVAEGWTEKHDDQHSDGELAQAAACYAVFSAFSQHYRTVTKAEPPIYWPWDLSWWKPKNPRRDLVRAAALLIAEIERLDRAALKTANAIDQGREPQAKRPTGAEG